VAVSSVDPLRAYIYDKNNLFRFCNLPYDPNNFTDTQTYVIDSSHTTGNKFPEMQKYFNQSYTYKEAFNAIMRKMGHNPQVLYDQVDECVRTVLMAKEPGMIKEINRLNPAFGKYHFVEMYRFDFMIDAKLKVHLMEINMSPNMEAIPRYAYYRPMYENIVYNFLNLVGAGTYLEKTKIHSFPDNQRDFLCDADTTSVKADVCVEGPCKDTCDLPECELCWKCISKRNQWDFMISYMEHVNMGEMRRVVPPSNASFLKYLKNTLNQLFLRKYF
jgi:tubulin monoglycylase TTLL15